MTNSVRFVLDGNIVEARGMPSTTTVLDYLREHLHRTGTKEGCAEGDCGACVVLVGELNAAGSGVDYRVVNSCMQLLPTLNGKSLKTVESLKRADGSLHPVQEAMISCHGSQCGFCTPGIVMSLTGLVQTVACPSRQQVNDALSGNLCRCTGYKPIVDATLQACERPAADLKVDDQADVALLQSMRASGSSGVSVAPATVGTGAGGEFVAPGTLKELADYLVANPDATLVAGSSEIGLRVNKQFVRPAKLAYVGNVTELRAVHETDRSWRLGATVSLSEVQALVASAYPDFAEVLRRFASPPVRSTATLAGNIANGSPIGDSMPCLMVLGAYVHLRSASQTRVVPLDQFYTGYKKNVLQPGEFIEAIELPKPLPGRQLRAHKISKRFEQDIAALHCAMTYELRDGRLLGVKLAFNGLAPFVGLAPRVEAVLEGRRPDDVTAAAIDEALAASYTPLDDLRASSAYRLLVARNLVVRFVEEAAQPSQLAEVAA